VARLGTYVAVQGAPIRVEAALLGVKPKALALGVPCARACRNSRSPS